VRGRAGQISAALANLTPFAEDTDDILRVLRAQGTETRTLIRDTGEVFAALTERKGQLRALIRNSNRTWEAIASRNRQLADTFTVFPTFLRESRATTRRLTSFAHVANPLVTQLRPAARQISPTLVELDRLSPDLRGFFQDLKPLVRVSRAGLPATKEVLDNTRPILRRLDPFLRELTPVVDYLGLYKREIAAFFGNDSAATQALAPGFADSSPVHYLRVMNPLNPEIMTGYQNRLGTNRYNPYTEPGAYDRLAQGQPLPVFGNYLCTSNPTPSPPPPNEYMSQRLSDEIKRFVFGIGTGNEGRAPPCVEQAPLGRLVGQPGRYPHVEPLP
jgi:phospholipid/cholesterol/gamma-HCH transport system substrate-binding protein